MSISALDFHFERNKFRLVFGHTTWSECYFLDNFQYFFGTFPKTFFGQFPILFWNISKNLFGTFPILFWINFQKLFGTFPILFWKVSKIFSDHFQRYLQIIISLDYYFFGTFPKISLEILEISNNQISANPSTLNLYNPTYQHIILFETLKSFQYFY